MAKKNKSDSKHIQNTENYARQIDSIYRSAVREAAAIGLTVSNFKQNKPFSFADYPITHKRMDKLINELQTSINAIIINGIDAEWTLANNKNSELANIVFGDNVGKLSQEQYQRYYSNNHEAREAFIARKDNGLNLSDRVWRYSDQFKSEIEMGLDLGIRNGMSADEMSRDLRDYLQNPDKLFRRVRDAHGQLHLSKAAMAFHPGAGVYRSSYKNAMRLTRTETNIAYRTADFTRWQQLDFVVGIEIRLSNNHPCPDICDMLAGKYPKDFKFTGWHPQCMCHAIPILKTMEEMQADNERIMNSEQVVNESTNSVRNVPDEFNKWFADNEGRLAKSKSSPYFITDNPKYTGVVPRIGAVGAYAGTKLGRTATKAAYAEYGNAKPTLVTNEQRENIDVVAKSMGTTAKPMTFLEANEGRGNVNFGKGKAYDDNCQCCIAVHEARLRGLNVTALGYNGNKDSVQWLLGENFEKMWVNPKTGKQPSVSILRGKTDNELFLNLERQMLPQGRYHIGVNFADNRGHVITAERLASGKVVYYDPQSGTFINIREYTALDYLELLRVDKLMFSPKMIQSISEVIH